MRDRKKSQRRKSVTHPVLQRSHIDRRVAKKKNYFDRIVTYITNKGL